MSDKQKGVRVLLGSEASCSSFSKAELAILDDILNARVSVRSTVVHNALRIVCQAVLENPDGGYPASLYELRQSGSAPGTVLNARVEQASVNAVQDRSPATNVDWLTGESPEESAPVAAAPSQTDDPERAEVRSRAQQFIG